MQTYVNTQYCNSGSKKKRYGVRLTVVQNSQSVANNTSNITVTFELGGAGALGLSTDYTGSSFNGYTCTGTIYVNGSQKSQGSSTAKIANNTKVTLTSWKGNVSHNNDGTLSIPIRGVFTGGLSSQTDGGEASGTVTFDTIPRASSVTCTNANIGAKPTITITRASSSFTHTLKYSFNGLTGTIATGVGTSYTNWTIPTSFYAKIPNANSDTCTITCETYSGSSLIGTKTTSFTANVPSTATPSAPTNVTIEDTDSISKNTIGVYVVGKSKIKFNFPAFHSDYGATLSTYTLNLNGTNYSTTSQNYTMTVPVDRASNTYSVTVTDSRGKTASSGNKTFTAYDYSPPNGNLAVERNGTTPTNVSITYSGTVTNINNNNKNIPSYSLQYKKKTDSTWANVPNITFSGYSVSGTAVQTGVSDSYTYDYKLTVSDSYSSASYPVQIGTSATLMNFSADGKGLAFGKASEEASTFECALKSKFTKQVDMTGSLNVSGTVNQIGSLNSLTTTAKTNVVSAINELVTNMTGMKTQSVLWSDAWYMNGYQTVRFKNGTTTISAQTNGIALVWSPYINGTAQDWSWNVTFIPKWNKNLNGHGHTIVLSTHCFDNMGSKYIYVYDDRIEGHADNTKTGTGNSGIVYKNDYWVLRYVIGV